MTFINWFSLHLQRLRGRWSGAKVVASRGQALAGPDVLVDLETVANRAGVHSSTIRRWATTGLIPGPITRRKRKLYWTPDDAWLVQVYSMPGVYHAEQRNPVESNSTGPDVTPSNEIESI